MVFLDITLDTQAAHWRDLKPVFEGGKIIHAEGVFNLKWEEFSALDFAREAGLQEIEWDDLHDDTPGRITLTLEYDSATHEDIQEKLNDPYVKLWVEDYDLRSSSVLRCSLGTCVLDGFME